MSYEKDIHDFLAHCTGRVIDVIYVLYGKISALAEEEQPKALMYLCDNIFNVDSDNSNMISSDKFSDEKMEEVVNKIAEKVRAYFQHAIYTAVVGGVEEEEFYSRIWKYIQYDAQFLTTEERVYALFLLMNNDHIPYRNIGVGISMSEERYSTIVGDIGSTLIEDTRYILDFNYEQRTQRASLLVNNLLSLKDSNQQAVYMSIILEQVKKDLKGKMQKCIDSL